ncbi:hypothetical protein BDU57DRAFT_271738 [Ampelomyces quisqualis]|uniref:Uncharacterized protein n=1 Tax=Ampelomyces quisqualis TaxID=50730 RepID=A0A6A5QIG6_AMPQU|nr:hypothetical protein BDU57DRAFT_271738 [Ampelomyces quisqualis]
MSTCQTLLIQRNGSRAFSNCLLAHIAHHDCSPDSTNAQQKAIHNSTQPICDCLTHPHRKRLPDRSQELLPPTDHHFLYSRVSSYRICNHSPSRLSLTLDVHIAAFGEILRCRRRTEQNMTNVDLDSPSHIILPAVLLAFSALVSNANFIFSWSLSFLCPRSIICPSPTCSIR